MAAVDVTIDLPAADISNRLNRRKRNDHLRRFEIAEWISGYPVTLADPAYPLNHTVLLTIPGNFGGNSINCGNGNFPSDWMAVHSVLTNKGREITVTPLFHFVRQPPFRAATRRPDPRQCGYRLGDCRARRRYPPVCRAPMFRFSYPDPVVSPPPAFRPEGRFPVLSCKCEPVSVEPGNFGLRPHRVAVTRLARRHGIP